MIEMGSCHCQDGNRNEYSAKDYAVMYYEAVEKGLGVDNKYKEDLFWKYRRAVKEEIREGKGFNKSLLKFIYEIHTAEFNEMRKIKEN